MSRPTKKLKTTVDTNADQILRDQTDIWVTRILPFLGPGYYIFVAGVNRRFMELYQEYFSLIPIQKLPMVEPVLGATGRQQPAVVANTFYSAAFSSVPCAELWKKAAL